MRKWAGTALMVASLLALPLAAPMGATAATGGVVPPAGANASLAIADLFSEALTQVQADDFEGALQTLRAITVHPAFEVGPNAAKFGVFTYLAMVEASVGEIESAFEHLTVAGGLAPQGRDGTYWTMLAALSDRLSEHAMLVEAVLQLIRNHPDEVAEWEHLVVAARRSAGQLAYGGGRHVELLEALWDAQFEPSNPYATSQGHWFELLTLYAENDEEAKARQVLPAIARPDLVAALSYDARLGRLAPADPEARFVEALEQDLAARRALMTVRPRDLAALQRFVDQLDWANRSAEALELIEGVLGPLAESPPRDLAFDDLDEYLAWAENTRSRVLLHLGRWDEAVAAQLRARDVSTQDPISQSVNLGVLYYQLGRPQEALDAIAAFTDDAASDYGLMAVEEVRVCASQQLGESAAVAKSLTFMRAHADAGYLPLRWALLCADDLDGLAAIIVDRLADPRTRRETLEDLQIYLSPPRTTPMMEQLAARFEAVKQRPAVAAAIERYGAVRAWPTLPHPW